MPYKKDYLTDEERNRIPMLLEEARSRGLIPRIRKSYDLEKNKKNKPFPKDENGCYYKYDGTRFKPNESQLNFLRSDAYFLGLIGGRGSGKALSVDTPIPTNNGWKLMSDIKIGDIVFDEFGKQTPVESVSDVMYNHDCYKISFSDGSSIIADGDHLWSVFSSPTKSYRIYNTKYLFGLTRKSGNNYNYLIKGGSPVEYSKKQLPLHPYLLGAWLGDGSSRDAKICCNDEEIINKIQDIGYPMKLLTSEKMSYSLANSDDNKSNVQIKLKELGVKDNKHIPDMYLLSSVEDRLELLYGLMDTDGSVSDRGHCCFDNINEELIDDVYELICSLGIKATKKQYEAKIYGVPKGITYKIAFTAQFPVFYLSRKRDKQRILQRTVKRSIIEIKQVKSNPVKCISVKSKTHLYLAGKTFIPTHNSSGGSQKILQKIERGEPGIVANPDF